MIFEEHTDGEEFDLSEINQYKVLEQETFEKLLNALENMEHIADEGLIENHSNITNFRVQ